MKENSQLLSEKNELKNEDCCPCNCTTQLNELTTGKPSNNEQINKKSSCC